MAITPGTPGGALAPGSAASGWTVARPATSAMFRGSSTVRHGGGYDLTAGRRAATARSGRPSLRGRLRTKLILAVGVVLEVVLVFVLGLPEGTGLADLGHDLAGPHVGGVGVGDRVLGDLALLVARNEDLGAVVGAD